MSTVAVQAVQRVHEPIDIWDITFCTLRFCGSSYYWHLRIGRGLAQSSLLCIEQTHLWIQISNACPGIVVGENIEYGAKSKMLSLEKNQHIFCKHTDGLKNE